MFDTRLPQPSGTFEWVQVASRLTLVCRALEPLVQHLITTRAWTLGDGTRPDDGRAWTEVADAMTAPLVRVVQVHGAGVHVRRAGAGEPDTLQPATADIVVSNDPEVALAIQTADCVPLLVVDRRTGAVAAAHAGWRGLARGVPRVTVDALAREFGSRAGDLVAAAGPSIGACCYEVGAEVRTAFEETGWTRSEIDAWFGRDARPSVRNPSMPGMRASRPGHWYFDTTAAVRGQLHRAGVPRDQIFVADLCTASHPGALCSYRRDGSPAGRLAAAIRPRPRPPHRP